MKDNQIDSRNFDEVIVNLMLNLLRQAYPVKRIKDKNKFKRAVEVNESTFFIPKHNYSIFSTLYSELEELYDAESDEIMYVLKTFYKIKG